MSTIDSTGLTIDRYSDVLTSLETDIKAAFGDDTRVDARSVIGQLIQIFASHVADVNEFVEALTQIFDPQSATGAYLSRLVLLNGIERQEAEYSTVSLTITANAAGTTVPAGSIVEHATTGVQFATDLDITVSPSTSGYVSATALEPGPVSAAKDTLTVIKTPVYGWSDVNNAAAAVEGCNEETDTELRIRRQAVAERAGSASISGIYGAISDVTGVDDLMVLENTGTTVDSNGVQPQHVWCIVDGGSDADVAEAIFGHVGAGIGMMGSTIVSHYDSVSGASYDVKFTRPEDINIYIVVNLTTDSDYPSDGDDLIEAALEDYFAASQGLGDNVIHSRLYTPVNSIEGHQVDSLYIGIAPSPTGTSNLTIDVDQRAVCYSVTVNS